MLTTDNIFNDDGNVVHVTRLVCIDNMTTSRGLLQLRCGRHIVGAEFICSICYGPVVVDCGVGSCCRNLRFFDFPSTFKVIPAVH